MSKFNDIEKNCQTASDL